MTVPSTNVVTPNDPLGPMVDIIIGGNKAMTTTLSGAMTTPMLKQQGVLDKNIVDVYKLQQYTLASLNQASLNKTNKGINASNGVGTNLIHTNIGNVAPQR